MTNDESNQKSKREWRSAKMAVLVSKPKFEAKDEKFFDNLHDKVMARLDEKIDDNVVVLPVRRRFIAVAAVITLLMIGSLIWLNLPEGQFRSGKKIDAGDALISASRQNLDSFSDSLINDRDEGDFFVEVATQKMKTLSQDETASVFNRLME